MKIYLARHGQSQWQIERNDNWDSALTELGQQQAVRLGQWLAAEAEIQLCALRVSTLQRAQQTVEPIQDALGLPVVTDEHLGEADFYVSSHLPQRVTPAEAYTPYEPSEMYTLFKDQAERALHHLVDDVQQQGGPVLAVSHGGLISTLLRVAMGSDWVSFWVYNATLNLLEWRRGRWHIIYLNRWDHLPQQMRTF